MEDVTDSIEELKIVGSPPASKLFTQLQTPWDSKPIAGPLLPNPVPDTTQSNVTERRHKFYIGGFHSSDERKISQFGPIPEKDPSDDPAIKAQSHAGDRRRKFRAGSFRSLDETKAYEFGPIPEKDPFDETPSTPVSTESQIQGQRVDTCEQFSQKPTLITSKFSASNPTLNSSSQSWNWFHAAFKKPVKSLSRTSSNSSIVSMTSETNEDSPSVCTECRKLQKTFSLRELNSMSPTSW